MSRRANLKGDEKQILTSAHRIYKRFIDPKDNKMKYNVYDIVQKEDQWGIKRDVAGTLLRTESANRAHSQFKLIKMNQTIKKVQDKLGVSQKEAREHYFIKQAEIQEGRIKNIMKIENMNRTRAEEHYSHLINTKQYNRLKKYS
jgi:hypothetical protein